MWNELHDTNRLGISPEASREVMRINRVAEVPLPTTVWFQTSIVSYTKYFVISWRANFLWAAYVIRHRPRLQQYCTRLGFIFSHQIPTQVLDLPYLLRYIVDRNGQEWQNTILNGYLDKEPGSSGCASSLMESLPGMRILMPNGGCLRNQSAHLDPSRLGLFFFAHDVYLTRRLPGLPQPVALPISNAHSFSASSPLSLSSSNTGPC